MSRDAPSAPSAPSAPTDRVEELEGALRELILSGKSYMVYHTNKFYPDSQAPAGLTPALKKAEEVLKKSRGGSATRGK